MNIFQALLLSVVQGITEFLPVSSSGHLNLIQHFLGLTPSLSFDIFLNTATLFSVLFFFKNQTKYFFSNLKYIIVGTIPAVIAGLFFKDQIEASFSSVTFLPYEFLISALVLLATKFVPQRDLKLNYFKAFLIGLAQAIAILPAISRSGATIVTALLLGLNPLAAFNFSFSLFIPASLGALVLDLKDTSLTSLLTPTYLWSFLVTFLVGLVSLYFLRRLLSRGRLWLFSLYLFVLSFSLFFIL